MLFRSTDDNHEASVELDPADGPSDGGLRVNGRADRRPRAGWPRACLSEATRVAKLFEMTSDLLATISLDGRFTLLNPAWEQLLGWTREELLARSVQELVHPDDLAQTRALMFDGSHRAGPHRNLHQSLPPPRRLLALAVVERAPRWRRVVRRPPRT